MKKTKKIKKFRKNVKKCKSTMIFHKPYIYNNILIKYFLINKNKKNTVGIFFLELTIMGRL